MDGVEAGQAAARRSRHRAGAERNAKHRAWRLLRDFAVRAIFQPKLKAKLLSHKAIWQGWGTLQQCVVRRIVSCFMISTALDQNGSSPPALSCGAESGRLGRTADRRQFFLRPRFCRHCRRAAARASPMAAYETYLRFTHIYEYDARATADIVTISSRAEGWVVEMPALEGTRVKAGDVVARIDDRIAKLKIDSLQGPDRGRPGRAHAAEGRAHVQPRAGRDRRSRRRTSGVTVREKARRGAAVRPRFRQARARPRQDAVRHARDQRAPAADGADRRDQARDPDPADGGRAPAGRRQPRRGARRPGAAEGDRRADRGADPSGRQSRGADAPAAGRRRGPHHQEPGAGGDRPHLRAAGRVRRLGPAHPDAAQSRTRSGSRPTSRRRRSARSSSASRSTSPSTPIPA